MAAGCRSDGMCSHGMACVLALLVHEKWLSFVSLEFVIYGLRSSSIGSDELTFVHFQCVQI